MSTKSVDYWVNAYGQPLFMLRNQNDAFLSPTDDDRVRVIERYHFDMIVDCRYLKMRNRGILQYYIN